MKIKHLKYILFLILCFCLFTLGCRNVNETQVQFEYPSSVEVKDGMYTINNDLDSMTLTKTEYLSSPNGELVIDPNYYQTHELKRGDVIYYKTPANFLNEFSSINYPQKNIARIVGLPNEKFAIGKGQIYIHNKKLEAFYGKALTAGLYKKEFLKMIKTAPGKCEVDCLYSYKQTFDLDLEEFLIPNDDVFIIGDNWSRSLDSRLFGSLPVDHILGKVMGYKKT
ncbi:signal peptidase I [Paenibacillus sp. NPDC058174]|uniref:signal peptidase I n=1 Tax=Paenibacillus sp. NPDC058174 TaxID=3346366 RepID=UPI0036DA3743